MKLSINVKSIIIAATLLYVGAILILLGSASLGIFSSYPIDTLARMYGLLPLVLLVGILALVFIPAKARTTKSANSKAARILSVLGIVSFLAGMLVTKVSTLNLAYNQTRGQFVLENIGTAAIFLAYVFAGLLANQQNYVYWPLWNRINRKQADERQLFVRQRVFEKSYRYVIFLFVGSLILVGFQASRMQKIAPFLAILAVMSLPAIVATWQKDS